MKKIIYTLFAFAAVTFVSCTKEESTPENEQTQPEVELVPMTFTAGVDTKVTLGEKNAINWEETDKISIFDGTDNREFTIVKGSITGNTATFTGEVAASAKDFVALYPYTKGASYIDGKITGVPLSKTGKFAPVATASASSDNNTLNFTTVIGFVKFKLADAEGVTSVTISGNNGELIGGSITIDTKEGKTNAVAPAITLAPAGGISANTEYYIPMAACTIPSGITISTTNDTQYSYKTSTKSTEIAANKAFNLGSLSDFNSTPKNYVKWIHGDSFTIGGQTFNQATNGNATLVNTDDTEISNNGVYFVNSTVNNTSINYSSSFTKCIIISNSDEKANIKLSNKILFGKNSVIAFKNINVAQYTDHMLVNNVPNNDNATLIFDGCRFSLPEDGSKGLVYCAETRTITDFKMINCDVAVNANNQNIIYVKENSNGQDSWNTIEFNNNIFYSQSDRTQFKLFNGKKVILSSLSITNNSYINTYLDSDSGYANAYELTTSLTIKENLYDLGNYKSVVNKTYRWVYISTAGNNEQYYAASKNYVSGYFFAGKDIDTVNDKTYAIKDTNYANKGAAYPKNTAAYSNYDYENINFTKAVDNKYGATR